MSISIFADKKNKPTEDEIRAAIGPLLPVWDALVAFVRATYPVEGDFHFMYGKLYGWALWFRIKGRLLTSLYPTQGGFRAQLNLSPEAVETALAMGLGRNAHDAIAAAPPYVEGRWVFIPVASEADAQDVRRLLALRVKTERLCKTPAT